MSDFFDNYGNRLGWNVENVIFDTYGSRVGWYDDLNNIFDTYGNTVGSFDCFYVRDKFGNVICDYENSPALAAAHLLLNF